ncbi:hypothetical protein MHO82_20175 [Vibrio sp. Of7-15]|uniref:hypothetical protein n=1 Tax=Vibrio sp. Of7-15 TaxID=2724879 RepID=UPI001EF239E7|nr:hypothetical protein [Vibrio sp. Of7-15]MCG7499187.1 hypothetical protein [Vibrio sp. Of7-15]
MKQENETNLDRDELLRRAQQAVADNSPPPEPVHKNASFLVTAIAGVLRFFASIRDVLLRPFLWLKDVFSERNRVFRWLKAAVIWLAFEPVPEGSNKEDNELRFSSRRLGIRGGCVSGVVIAGYFAVIASYFYGTQFEELVYTTGKQEIEAGEQYQFTGCTSLPCSTQADNGKYYKIEASHFFPSLYYPEEDVFANIPQQDGACYAKGYGVYFRNLRSLFKYFQWYQKVYDVSCRPYTEEEKQMAVGTGKISKVEQ